MKLFLISNTNFGDKNIDDFISYFNEIFKPYIIKYSKPDDYLIHMGGLFNSKNINIAIYNKVYELFLELSKIIRIKMIVSDKDCIEHPNNNSMLIFKNIPNIEIITNNSIYDNFQIIPYTKNINKVKIEKDIVLYNNAINLNFGINGYHIDFDGIKNIGSPYQFNESDMNKKRGFVVYDTLSKKYMFVENKYNKTYKIIEIKSKDDLELIPNNSDSIINIKINNSFYDNNKNIVDVMLSRYNINKIIYVDDNILENNDEQNDIILDIENNIINEIKTQENGDILLNEFMNILEIYNKKFIS